MSSDQHVSHIFDIANFLVFNWSEYGDLIDIRNKQIINIQAVTQLVKVITCRVRTRDEVTHFTFDFQEGTASNESLSVVENANTAI
jgi:hypothetical protein